MRMTEAFRSRFAQIRIPLHCVIPWSAYPCSGGKNLFQCGTMLVVMLRPIHWRKGLPTTDNYNSVESSDICSTWLSVGNPTLLVPLERLGLTHGEEATFHVKFRHFSILIWRKFHFPIESPTQHDRKMVPWGATQGTEIENSSSIDSVSVHHSPHGFDRVSTRSRFHAIFINYTLIQHPLETKLRGNDKGGRASFTITGPDNPKHRLKMVPLIYDCAAYLWTRKKSDT